MGHGLSLGKMKDISNTGKGAEKTPADGSVGTGLPTGHMRWHR